MSPRFCNPVWTRMVNTHDKQHCVEELTTVRSDTAGSKSASSSVTVDPLEELSSAFGNVRNPKFLVCIESAQCPGFRLFEHVLCIPKHSLQQRRVGQKVCIVDRVQLCLFNMSVCFVQLAFPKKQDCQGEMNPGQLRVGVEGGCNREGYLVIVNGLIRVAPFVIYIAKSTMTYTDPKFLVFLWEDIDPAGCSFLCGVELSILTQQMGKVDQIPCLTYCTAKPFEDSRCFLGLLCPFFAEAHDPVYIR